MPNITISVSNEMKAFVSEVINDGTYSNVSEVFRDGIRAVQERHLKLTALRSHIEKAIAEEARFSDEEIETFLHAEAAKAD